MLQANCTSVYNNVLEFWNLVDTYNPDVIGMESWLKLILAMLKSSGLILQLSEARSLPVVVGFLFVLKIYLPLRTYEYMMILR